MEPKDALIASLAVIIVMLVIMTYVFEFSFFERRIQNLEKRMGQIHPLEKYIIRPEEWR